MELLNYKVYSHDGTISFHKPVLVMIHGLGAGNANWVCQVRHLKKQYDLLLIELPSHGKSKVRMSQLEPTFEAVSDKVMEVLDHLGIQKATFLGVSLGSLVVKTIVLTHSDRVDKYMLIGPVGQITTLLKIALHVVMILLRILPLQLILTLGSQIILPHKNSSYARDIFLACAQRMDPKELLAWARAILSFEKTQYKFAKTMKDEPNGVYIVGALDHFFLTMLGNDLKRAKNVVMVKNAGHLCNIDQYEAVNHVIIVFQETGTLDPKMMLTASHS